MKILRLSFIIFLIISFNHLKANNENMKNEITKNLRCLICQGQSVYDSDSEFANSLKIMVDKKLKKGYQKKKFIDFLRINTVSGFYMIHFLIKTLISYGYCLY